MTTPPPTEQAQLPPPARASRRWLVLAVAVLVVLLLLRSAHLAADPPTWISGSGDLYTDEGWWATNAAAQYFTGDWYQPGGYNPAVAAPVMPMLENAAFRLYGFGLLTARRVSLACALTAMLLLCLLIARREGRRAAWYCALLLAGSYLVFTFSRLAFLEMPLAFGICLSLWCAARAADSKDPRAGYLQAAMAGAALLFAVLTKTTALFALPVVLWMLWQSRSSSLRARWVRVGLFLAVLALLGGAYAGHVMRHYPDDARLYLAHNLANKVPSALRQPAAAVDGRAPAVAPVNNTPLLIAAWGVLALGLALLAVPALRRSRLYAVALL